MEFNKCLNTSYLKTPYTIQEKGEVYMFDKWQKNKEDAAADANGMQGGSVLTLEQAEPITQSIINRLGNQ